MYFVLFSCVVLCASVGAQERAKQPSGPFDGSTGTKLPVIPPIASETIESAIDRGVAFLIKDQNSNGSWGSATKTKALNIFAPVPGAHHAFRAGTTALSLAALIEVADDQPDAKEAIRKAESWMMENLPLLRRATGTAIYNVWGHAYGIQALVRLHQRHSASDQSKTEYRKLIESQFDMLQRYESVDGGWGYYDFRYGAQRPTSSSISFVNGAVLVALDDARSIGLDPPERLVQRAIAATKRQQKPDMSYLYGEYLKDRPMREINRPGGSLGRSQCCNAALRRWGDEAVTDEVLKTWLHRLYERNGWLDIGRKRPVPHESWMQVAGYFYYFGHYYAGLCLESLPKDQQTAYKPLLAKLMLDRQEKNGAWWDYPLYDYHRPYGTGFALMTLHRCR